MSREIKFRVWVESILDEETGMYTPDYISSWQNGTNWDIDKVYTKMREPGGYKFKEDTCKFTLMQYTGLKDRNGVEIYEGDIIEIPADEYRLGRSADESGEVETASNLHRFTIEWDSEASAFMAFDVNDRANYGALARGVYIWVKIGRKYHNGEVIGNIYSNPELLKGDQ